MGWQPAIAWPDRFEVQAHGRPPDPKDEEPSAKKLKVDCKEAAACHITTADVSSGEQVKDMEPPTSPSRLPTPDALEPVVSNGESASCEPMSPRSLNTVATAAVAFVASDQLTPTTHMPPLLQQLAAEIAPHEGLVDCGTNGACGPNSLAFQLERLGLHEGGGLALRADVVNHAACLAASDEIIMAAQANETLHARAFLLAALLSSPAFEDVHTDQLSHDTWLALMRRPTAYADEAFMAIAADCYQVDVSYTALGLVANSHRRSSGTFRPLQGKSPRAHVKLVIWANVHMMARVAITDADTSRPVPPEGGLTSPQPRADTEHSMNTIPHVFDRNLTHSKQHLLFALPSKTEILREGVRSPHLEYLTVAMRGAPSETGCGADTSSGAAGPVDVVHTATEASLLDSTPKRLSRKELRAATRQASMNSIMAAGSEAVARSRREANEAKRLQEVEALSARALSAINTCSGSDIAESESALNAPDIDGDAARVDLEVAADGDVGETQQVVGRSTHRATLQVEDKADACSDIADSESELSAPLIDGDAARDVLEVAADGDVGETRQVVDRSTHHATMQVEDNADACYGSVNAGGESEQGAPLISGMAAEVDLELATDGDVGDTQQIMDRADAPLSVWQPSSTSVMARLKAERIHMSTSMVATSRPDSYSESPWLAPGLGIALRDARDERLHTQLQGLQEQGMEGQACQVSGDGVHLAPRCGYCKWVTAADTPPVACSIVGMHRATCSHCEQCFSHPGPFCVCPAQQRQQGDVAPTVKRYIYDAASRRQGTDKAIQSDAETLARAASQGLSPGLPGQESWRPLREQTPDFGGPLFQREYRLPLGDDFVWPRITHYAFYEDKGHIREAWRAIGVVSCSVADRPTMIPPSDGCYHFIAQVYDFVQAAAAAGLTIVKQTNHIECGPATWSSWKTWPAKILDGRMLEAGEEFIWINSLGDASLGEQPHTAHEHTVGPPTQIINANQHDGANKTWCLWTRHVDDIPPSDIVPLHERHDELSHVSGSKEERMLQRSGTEPQMARAIVATMHATQTHIADAGRAANVPGTHYHEHRRAFRHNLGILAAAYAPTLARDVLTDASRVEACAIIMPLAPTPVGPVVMVPLQGSEVFGVQLDGTRSPKEQAEEASRFLSIGIETQYMHGMKDSPDLVVAVPWDVSPAVFITSPQQLLDAREAHQPAVWATADAIAGSLAYEPALYAIQRVIAMQGAVLHDDLNVGVWRKAKPAIMRQRAAAFASAPDDKEARTRWQQFIAKERKRDAIMRADLINADRGDNLLLRVCSDVRTAADYEAELPVPPQRLPEYDDPALLFILVPEPPLPLIKEWLHTLPPQAVPPGFRPMPWSDVMRTWARRMTCDFRNQNMVYDAYCLEQGSPPTSMKRADDIVFGRGAAKQIRHEDGIGTWNAFDVILEVRADGLLDALDYTKVEPRPWFFEAIAEYIGSDSNQEILSFIFHGVRWKLDAPRQVRLCHNLARLNAIVPEVNEALFELERLQYIEIRWVCRVQDKFDVDGPCPFNYIPGWDVGIGGLMKANGKARCVGNMTAPLGKFERNAPEGPPDGEAVVSFNDLSGPKGGAKEGYKGPLPFPDPEIKPRPRHKYAALVLLRFYANLNNTFVVMAWDDMWQMFFQFKVAIEDRPWCNWNTVARREGHTFQLCIKVGTMNQGGRNSSKIACEMANPWLAAWATQMDAFVEGWLPNQLPPFREAYKQRRSKLGLIQARPFWGGVYTDNFEFDFMASDLAAEGFRIWLVMNKRANIRLQEHVGYGTCTDWIGGRCVAMGGFGCLVPSKRQRAITHSHRALKNQLARELYEKHISFLVHASDICDWPHGLLKGLAGPLRKPGLPEDMIELTPNARVNIEQIVGFMTSRPLASFYSGVDDAILCLNGTGQALLPIRTHATDTCTDPAPFEGNPDPKPHIAGMVDGMYWRFELAGEWLDRHITLTEGAGPGLHSLVAVPLFPADINVLGGDATAAVAATVGAARSVDMLTLTKTLREEPAWRRVANTIWTTHWKGWGNGITDALSRDNVPLAVRLATAFGIKLHEIPLTPDAHRFMWRLKVRTRPLPDDKFQIGLRGLDGKTLMMYAYDSMTVASVLEVYEVEVLWTQVSLRLVFQGKQLDPTTTMAAAGVQAHDTLHVLGRLDGGSPATYALFDAAAKSVKRGDPDFLLRAYLKPLAVAMGASNLRGPSYRAMRAAVRCILDPDAMLTQPWVADGAARTNFNFWFAKLSDIFIALPSQSECPSCMSLLVHCEACGLPLECASDDGGALCENKQCPRSSPFLGPMCECRAAPAAEVDDLATATNYFFADSHANVVWMDDDRNPLPIEAQADDESIVDLLAEIESYKHRHYSAVAQAREMFDMQRHQLLHLAQQTSHLFPSFDVFVTGLSGEHRIYSVRISDYIIFVLARYKQRNCMAHDTSLRLQWKGKQLDEMATIGEVGIKADDHIQVLPRNRGGMRSVTRSPSPLEVGSASGGQQAASHDGTLAHIAEEPISRPIATSAPVASAPTMLRVIPNIADSALATAGPPQPFSAAEARRASTRRVADSLVAKEGIFSIMPGDPQSLRTLVSQVGAARDKGIPKGTRAADEWGFNWAVKFGQHTNTRWMRPLVGSADIDEELEAWYEALKLFWQHQHMQPSKRRQAKGYTKALPSSSLLATYAHRRVMRDCGRFVGDLELARDVLKGVCEIYKTLFGPEAFLPQQAEIFSQQMLAKVDRFLEEGLVPTWTEALHLVWRALHAYLTSTGTRKDEWTRDQPAEDCIPRANFVWVDDDMNPLPMTPETIGSRRSGHLLRGMSGPSKCDRLNCDWGNQKQWFKYDATALLNFAYVFQQYELRFPCPVDCRSQWPAFSPTGDGVSFTPGLAADLHRQLCTITLGSQTASALTIHSYRATLASKHAAARANGASHITHALTQAHTRHKTLEALLTYEKTRPQDFADTVELSNRTDAGPTRRSDAAEIEPRATLVAVMDDMRAISGTSAVNFDDTSCADTLPCTPPRTAPSTKTAQCIDVVGSAAPIQVKGTDSWGMIGQRIHLPETTWDAEADADDYTECRITHFIGLHKFTSGGKQLAYTVTYEGGDEHYAVRADLISRYASPQQRATLRKQGPPRAVAAKVTGSPSAPPSPPSSPPSALALAQCKKAQAQVHAAFAKWTDVVQRQRYPTCGCCRFRRSPCLNDVLQANGNCQLCNESYGDCCNCPCEGCNPEDLDEAAEIDADVCDSGTTSGGNASVGLANVLQGLTIAPPRLTVCGPPPGAPPPSPPPSPAGGDRYGTRRKARSSSWGRTDKAGKERARRDKWKKLARSFEREARNARHPQECPVCLDAEQTCLMIDCGNDDMPWHRGHGLCKECATLIIQNEFACPLCGMPVHDFIEMGTEFFVN